MSKSDIERAAEFAKQLEGLLGDSKDEVIAKLLSTKIAPNLGGLLDRAQVCELTYAINQENFDGLREVVRNHRGDKVVEQIQDLCSSFAEDFSNLVQQDIERMGAQLTDLGFPDVRMDRENWRIIAKMVGANPNDLMEDIYESALAFAANQERSTKQANCLTENDRAILEAMFNLKATQTKPQTASTIVKAALYSGDVKRAFDRLKELGFVLTKSSRGGGNWLTESGVQAAKSLLGIGATDSPTDCTD